MLRVSSKPKLKGTSLAAEGQASLKLDWTLRNPTLVLGSDLCEEARFLSFVLAHLGKHLFFNIICSLLSSLVPHQELDDGIILCY